MCSHHTATATAADAAKGPPKLEHLDLPMLFHGGSMSNTYHIANEMAPPEHRRHVFSSAHFLSARVQELGAALLKNVPGCRRLEEVDYRKAQPADLLSSASAGLAAFREAIYALATERHGIDFKAPPRALSSPAIDESLPERPGAPRYEPPQATAGPTETQSTFSPMGTPGVRADPDPLGLLEQLQERFD
jgi:hypothetical protein